MQYYRIRGKKKVMMQNPLYTVCTGDILIISIYQKYKSKGKCKRKVTSKKARV